MSESENSDKTLTVAPSKTLHLKQRPAGEQGMVRQSFSHGRSKVVVVEKVKRRAPGHGEAPKQAAPTTPAPAAAAPSAPPPRAERPAPARGGSGVYIIITPIH